TAELAVPAPHVAGVGIAAGLDRGVARPHAGPRVAERREALDGRRRQHEERVEERLIAAGRPDLAQQVRGDPCAERRAVERAGPLRALAPGGGLEVVAAPAA